MKLLIKLIELNQTIQVRPGKSAKCDILNHSSLLTSTLFQFPTATAFILFESAADHRGINKQCYSRVRRVALILYPLRCRESATRTDNDDDGGVISLERMFFFACIIGSRLKSRALKLLHRCADSYLLQSLCKLIERLGYRWNAVHFGAPNE